jgi:hypothetical protein
MQQILVSLTLILDRANVHNFIEMEKTVNLYNYF